MHEARGTAEALRAEVLAAREQVAEQSDLLEVLSAALAAARNEARERQKELRSGLRTHRDPRMLLVSAWKSRV